MDAKWTEMQWEKLKYEQEIPDDFRWVTTYRLKVPGGWLYRVDTHDLSINGIELRRFAQSVVFVPKEVRNG